MFEDLPTVHYFLGRTEDVTIDAVDFGYDIQVNAPSFWMILHVSTVELAKLVSDEHWFFGDHHTGLRMGGLTVFEDKDRNNFPALREHMKDLVIANVAR